VKARHDYLPFGEEVPAGIGGRTAPMGYGVNEGLKQRFTSKQRDMESNLDYFGARYYSSPQGRFTAVDPLDGSAHLSLPQTWNRYAYVLNNPLAIIDPNGMGWYQLGSNLYWDDLVTDQESAVKRHGKKAEYLPPGTIVRVLSVTGGGVWKTLVGHRVELVGDNPFNIKDLGKPKPPPVKQIEFYGGDGEKFLLAYFKFALENVVAGYVGSKAVEGIQFLYRLAKAKRAGKAVFELLEAAKDGNSIGAMKKLEYVASPKHGAVARGNIAAAPSHGQEALDLSLRISENTTRRVGVDYATKEFVVFDETSTGVFHGHVRSWSQLEGSMQRALIKEGVANSKGKIL
jgi:RHS repeat-associated protein